MKKKENLKAIFYPDVPFESLYIPYIYKEIYFEGVYVDIFNQKKDMVVVDVGANIGIVTQYMRDFAKKVYAIEPSPEHFEALKKNKEFNKWDNVEVFDIAIADKDRDDLKISQNEFNRTMNTLIVSPDRKNEEGKLILETGVKDLTGSMNAKGYEMGVPVKCKGMDTFFKENNIESVDFMKFDVEGAEDMILRSDGFKKVADKIKAIEVEFHFPTWPQLVEYMISLGYQARRYESSAIIVLFTR